MRSILTVLCLGLALLAVTSLVMTVGVALPMVQESGLSLEALAASPKFKTLKVGVLLSLISSLSALAIWRMVRN